PAQPRAGVYWEDAPKLFAYFCRPPELSMPPGYLTTIQAANATGLTMGTISSHLGTYGTAPGTRGRQRRRKKNGVIQKPRFGKSSYIVGIPISELKRIHGEFINEPEPLKEESSRRMFLKLLQFHLLCPVRPDNLLHLRWRNYKPEVEGGIIEYLPKRKDLNT